MEDVSLEKPRQLEFRERNADERKLQEERTPATCRGSPLRPQFNNDQCMPVRKMLEGGERTTQKELREQILELLKAGNSLGFYKPEWKNLLIRGVWGRRVRSLLLQ